MNNNNCRTMAAHLKGKRMELLYFVPALSLLLGVVNFYFGSN